MQEWATNCSANPHSTKQQLTKYANKTGKTIHVKVTKQLPSNDNTISRKENAGLPPLGNTTWLDQHHFVNTVLLCSPSGLIVTTEDAPTLSLLAWGFNIGTLLSALPDCQFQLYHEFNKFVLTSLNRFLRIQENFPKQLNHHYSSLSKKSEQCTLSS